MLNSCLAVGLALAVLVTGCSGGSKAKLSPPVVADGASTNPVAPSPVAPSATAVTEAIDGITVRKLTAGPPVALPEGYVFFEAQWAWEGPGKGVQRAYRDANGDVRLDVLWETKLIAPITPGGAQTGPAMSSVAASPGGRALAIGVCQGFCYGETGPITVIQSTDGGISWKDYGVSPNNSWVEAVGTESVFVGTLEGVNALGRNGQFAHVAVTSGGTPQVIYLKGEPPQVLIREKDGVTLSHPDGSRFARVKLPDGAQVEAFTRPVGRSTTPPPVVLDWSIPATPIARGAIVYTAFLNESGMTLREAYRWDSTLRASPSSNMWLTETREIRMVAFPITLFGDRFTSIFDGRASIGLPAVVDYETGIVSPIVEHFADNITGSKSGSPRVIAVARGPFARVTTGEDCLNVREQPTVSAVSLGCFANGVLLRLRPDAPQTAAGVTWRAVESPEGRAGWASAQFLAP